MAELDLTEEQWNEAANHRKWLENHSSYDMRGETRSMLDAVLALRPEPAHQWRVGDWADNGCMCALVDHTGGPLLVQWLSTRQWDYAIWFASEDCKPAAPPASWVAAGRPGAVRLP